MNAKSNIQPKVLTVGWAVEAVARLGGYLEHRRKTPIGIQVQGARLVKIARPLRGLATC